eukprot:13017583-Alexandrium_andersonii.AAC.1
MRERRIGGLAARCDMLPEAAHRHLSALPDAPPFPFELLRGCNRQVQNDALAICVVLAFSLDRH